MSQNSEARNIGYEKHPLFEFYKNDVQNIVERCETCGSENLYRDKRSDDPTVDSVLKCGECNHATDYDLESFPEWCSRKGIDPNTNIIMISDKTNLRIIEAFVNGLTENSPRIIIQGENWDENI